MRIGYLDDQLIQKKIKFLGEGFTYSKDSLLEISLLTLLAGYKKSKKIQIEGYLRSSLESLRDFINFLLNHKGFAPIKYNLQVLKGEKKIKNGISQKKKTLILASGGIDSTASILHYLTKGIKPLLVYIHFGQTNNKNELKRIIKIADKLKLKLIIVKIDLSKEVLAGWKDWSYIVPARNFLFTSIAAGILSQNGFWGDIILSSTQEEFKHPFPGPDKSPRFYHFCSKLYSREYKKRISVKTPFKNFTKREILFKWRKSWEKKFNMTPYDTSTCYFGNECGKCNSCLKRSLALLASGWNLDPHIKKNPFQENKNKIEEYLDRMNSKTKGFTNKRRKDLILALKAASLFSLIDKDLETKIDSSLKIKKLINNHPLKKK